MGDFFYYGQKDTIRRLNELAGRGAVVASYAPAVGRSPLGGPNGFMDPAWLDPTKPILSSSVIGAGSFTKMGYVFRSAGGAAQFIKFATLPKSDTGASAMLRVDAVMGGWDSSAISAVNFTYGCRGSVPQTLVDWSGTTGQPNVARFMCYMEADLTYSIYLWLPAGGFGQAAFNVISLHATTIAAPVAQAFPTGTLVWDLGAPVGATGYVAPRVTSGIVDGRNVGTSANGALFARSLSGDPLADSVLTGGSAANRFPATTFHELFRLGMSGVAGTSYSGYWAWKGSEGNSSPFYQGYRMRLNAYDGGSGNSSATLLAVSGDGQVYVPRLRAGTSSEVVPVNYHTIEMAGVQGGDILNIANSAGFRRCDGDWGNTSNAAMIVMANTVTGRSSNNKGTVNTMGNDYAEYIFKSPICGTVAPGQIVGITADNKVTDKWVDAVLFSIKSTAPSFVGGDSWANDVGQRPSPQAGPVPTQPLRREDVVTQQPVPGTNPQEYEDVVSEPGDTDDDWAEKQAAYTAALAAHNIAVQQDAEAMAAFDAALEVERQKVDRIAIAGRVPVNVQGAQPGDYIVPVQDGAGIKGIAVHEDDLSMKQYLHAVGRVISIEPDGRAYVMVKVV